MTAATTAQTQVASELLGCATGVVVVVAGTVVVVVRGIVVVVVGALVVVIAGAVVVVGGIVVVVVVTAELVLVVGWAPTADATRRPLSANVMVRSRRAAHRRGFSAALVDLIAAPRVGHLPVPGARSTPAMPTGGGMTPS